METAITRNVCEIPTHDKRALEQMLGTSLAVEQQVFILAYTPGASPDEDVRREAKSRLHERLASNQAFARQHGISSAEADDAIEEAIRQTRRRE